MGCKESNLKLVLTNTGHFKYHGLDFPIKRSRAYPWFGVREQKYSSPDFPRKMKEAEVLYTEDMFPLLYYKGYHATVLGGEVNETILERDLFAHLPLDSRIEDYPLKVITRDMRVPFGFEYHEGLDYHEADRRPGETRADAKLRHHFEMYGGKALLTRGNGLKLRFQLACGCTLLQTFDYYKSRTPRIKKTIVSRLYPRQLGQSDSVVSAGFFELVASEGCKEHYPQLDLFGIHSIGDRVAVDIEGGRPLAGSAANQYEPTKEVLRGPERPISNYEVVHKGLIGKTFSKDEALHLVRDIAQRVR